MARPCNISVLSSLFFEVNKLVANQSMNCTGGLKCPFFPHALQKRSSQFSPQKKMFKCVKLYLPGPSACCTTLPLLWPEAQRGSGKRRWCGGAGGVEAAAWRRRRRFDPMAYVCKAFHGTNPFSERVGIFKVLIRLYICIRFVRKGGLISEEGNFNLCKN